MLLCARGLHRLGLSPIDFDLPAGGCLGISGPSGVGKSVLLRMLADLDPHDGDVRLDGRSQQDTPPCEWRRQVALLAAESQWWEPRVRDHFVDGKVPLLDELGFEKDPADWEIQRLSSGERERLALARVLALAPRVLLLDEPTANLDEQNASRVERLIENWRRDAERAVVWVSHDREQLARVADQRLHLEDGKWSTAA
ncbi:MAG: ATP-binding cassette domain-containing protein [Gammaproteobacteria bacterium]